MTRDQLLVDLRRALSAAEPERVEALLREIERRVPPDETLFVPGPEGIASKELLATVRDAVVEAFPDRGLALLDELVEREAKARVITAVLPRRGETYERVEGRCDKLLAGEACPRCGQRGGVHYTGTVVHEGSLEQYHLIHTEVTDDFRCAHCAATWSELRYL